MNDLDQKIKKRLIILVIFSVLFVAAIPMIPVGFSNGWYLIAIPSIVIVAAGFYGLPFGWSFLVSLKRSRSLALAIAKDGITKVSDLAAQFGVKEKTIVLNISELFQKRYLSGYKFNKDKTELVRVEPPKEPEKKVYTAVCGACGAPLPTDAEGVCKYCGTAYKTV
jgi:hypothetical protein